MNRFVTTFLALIGLVAVPPMFGAGTAHGDSGAIEAAPEPDWSFSGPFGRYDQSALRRGLQVYIDGCADCHSLRHVAYRSLSALGIGYGPEDIKAFAAEFEVEDGPDESGEMYMRPARPSDRFAPPYPNKEAARVDNKGMYPPDLSLITKARKDGANYLYAMLVGYTDPPEGEERVPGMYYNRYVPGHYTGMNAPLLDNLVAYDDGTEATVEQMSKDVTEFLAWAADPHMNDRKSLGIRVVIFLVLLTIMFIALKREVWAHLHTPPERDNEADETDDAVAERK
jgi:ubiquinol-cytochrome c reductase cytochrome c1 subunit